MSPMFFSHGCKTLRIWVCIWHLTFLTHCFWTLEVLLPAPIFHSSATRLQTPFCCFKWDLNFSHHNLPYGSETTKETSKVNVLWKKKNSQRMTPFLYSEDLIFQKRLLQRSILHWGKVGVSLLPPLRLLTYLLSTLLPFSLAVRLPIMAYFLSRTACLLIERLSYEPNSSQRQWSYSSRCD